MHTTIITDYNLSFAAEVIQNGGLVGVPTETVYGLAANGLNSVAVAMIYELKGRPAEKPISLLVSDTDMASSVCSVFPQSARILTKAFWPGPLTIVLPCNDTVPSIVTAGGGSIGLRCPNHPKTLELLRLVDVPLAAPSANLTDEPSPKSAQDVLNYFDGRIACVIDGGICTLGVESTVVSLVDESKPYEILRHGALDEEFIRRALNL